MKNRYNTIATLLSAYSEAQVAKVLRKLGFKVTAYYLKQQGGIATMMLASTKLTPAEIKALF